MRAYPHRGKTREIPKNVANAVAGNRVGHTPHTINAILNPNVPYRPVDDHRPITQATRAGLVLVVNLQLPVKSVQERIAYGKANPGTLSFSSTGSGSGGHRPANY